MRTLSVFRFAPFRLVFVLSRARRPRDRWGQVRLSTGKERFRHRIFIRMAFQRGGQRVASCLMQEVLPHPVGPETQSGSRNQTTRSRLASWKMQPGSMAGVELVGAA